MTLRPLLGAALLPLLLACSDEARDAVPADNAQDEPTERLTVEPDAESEAPAALARARISDTLGTFEGGVYGLALWEHPELSFESAVLAANGEAGLAVVPIDREIGGSVVEGDFDGPVAVGYTETTGFVAAASGDAVRLFTVDRERTFTPVGEIPAAADDLCMVGDVLLVIGAEATGFVIAADGEAREAFTLDAAGADCAATDKGFYIASASGPVRAFDAEGAAMSGGASDTVAAEGFAALRTAAGPAFAYPDQAGIGVTGMAGDAATVRIERREGAIGEVSMLAAGSGNFGSIYRDGVVALVADGTLALVPWPSIARAAGFEATETLSFRPADPVSAPEPAFELDLPPIEASPGPSARE